MEYVTLNNGVKIFYLDPALTTEGVTRGCPPVSGDITIYAPWRNVTIFCKNWSHRNDLIKIGHIRGQWYRNPERRRRYTGKNRKTIL